jgi:hypothetical protein
VLEEPADFPIATAADDTYRRVSMGVFEVLGERIGTDCRWPRTLHAVLNRLGLREVDLDVTHSVVGADRPMSRFWRLTLDQLGPALGERGIATPRSPAPSPGCATRTTASSAWPRSPCGAAGDRSQAQVRPASWRIRRIRSSATGSSTGSLGLRG